MLALLRFEKGKTFGHTGYTGTSMWIDPINDCTIWYVGDYIKKDAANYSSRIGALRLPGCAK